MFRWQISDKTEKNFLKENLKRHKPTLKNFLIKIMLLLASNQHLIWIKIITLPVFFLGYIGQSSILSKVKLLQLPIAYYYLKKYYYFFEKGLIRQAYISKNHSLLIVYDQALDLRKIEIENYLKIISTTEEDKYILARALIVNKNYKVAIFGTHATNQEIMKSIEEFDMLIIIKPKSDFNISHLPKLEKLVMYYNYNDSLRHKDKIAYFASNKIKILTAPNTRKESNSFFNTMSLAEPIFSASPLALHGIINTLVLMGVPKIKLFGFDFYMGDKIYSENYPSGLKQENGKVNYKYFLYGLARHDILFNFCLLKKMIQQYNIETDEHLAYIRDMSADTYLDLFEKKYGKNE
ncbi:hypothetical protein [Thiolinea disciformis]|uniref:hypothetical protein n=1 Tax=Thiolinea disciformis TaxID=125614 RepID=UPI00037D5D5F|nr:hypothetical protein [Thiolinea disciformis]